MSGPAGGMTATEHIARALGEPNVLTLDMGGTSADVGILVDGKQRHTTEYEIEWGLPAAVPLIDIKSIGAGGGSIAWIDAGGFLRVGPRSAGAAAGADLLRPRRYRGRPSPTRTSSSAGSTRTTSSPAACDSTRRRSTEAMEALGEPLGLGALELAASIVEIANENMASAIKMVSLERGHDPRRFALLAFGGAGPLHAAAVARLLGIPRVIVPQYPGVFSALGLLLADIRVDKVWTQAFRSNDVDASARQPAVPARSPSARVGELRQEGFAGEPEIRRAINMRYFGQNYEHEVEIDAGELDDAALERSFRRFDELHADRYGYLDRGRGDRARELQGHRDRAAPAARPLAGGRGDGRSRAHEPGGLRPRAAASSMRRSCTAPRSSRASRSQALRVIEEEGSTHLRRAGHDGRPQPSRARS